MVRNEENAGYHNIFNRLLLLGPQKKLDCDSGISFTGNKGQKNSIVCLYRPNKTEACFVEQCLNHSV